MDRLKVLTEKQARVIMKRKFKYHTFEDLRGLRQPDGTFRAYDINILYKSELHRQEHAERVSEHAQLRGERVKKQVEVLRQFLEQEEYQTGGYAMERKDDKNWIVTRFGKPQATFRISGKHTCLRFAFRQAMLSFPAFRADGLLTEEDFI